ncbi:HAMP domain-containing sensor histidine kinase [Frigoribacterium sp. PvP032]|uniref:sensor histidine kinase n=1 Tax=Frigoribacterium sp. PvP032 TaxID=2806589 RepID=UPI001AE2256E|nr:HAMP domain-containing sensor histidine kinase [Frigoribacterium sp. PvP032]MBP1189859.1 signal transduction histidine kinase [Frigoribacterium sp. PvP032]
MSGLRGRGRGHGRGRAAAQALPDPVRAADPEAAALQAAARSIGRQIVLVSGLVVVGALALTIAWVLHQTVPQERLEQVAAAGQGEVFVSATDVVAGLVVLGVAGVVFAGLVTVVIARRAVRPLGEALRLQRQFVADASHELRTPLAVLDARLQALQRKIAGGAATADENVTADLARLRDDSRALVDIVGDLLEAAGSDPAGGATEQGSAPLDDTVADVLRSMSVLAEEGGVALVQDAVAGVAARVRVPPASLRRVVLALVDNALGHAPRGSTITVSTQVRAGSVVLTVTDQGPGITGIDPTRVFDRFARSESAPTGPTSSSVPTAPAGGGQTSRPSFGIGLALVREIALRHGGSVRVASSSAAGTTLELTLPLADVVG